jgi:predicted flap endonuclease-1-like 5' DNA nuclease
MVLGAALAVFTASTIGLVLLVEPVLAWYYHLAWWSYIVAVDALNRRQAGRSLLRDRPGEFLWLALVSVAWWTLFEALNLRLGNWYYVMDHAQRAVRWTGGVLAFATVLPGIVETVELIENLGRLRTVRVKPLAWSPQKAPACVVLGAACFALPLAWPDTFFPLTWGSFVFLAEPWNRAHAKRSFLRDLEAGEAGPFCRTLLAGLVCGVLWEAWNYWARTKWIYTVPGFEDLKAFEMPLTGFLGFPPFAVECLVILRFLGEMRRRLPAPVKLLALPVGALATLGVFLAVDPVTVDSFHRPVSELTVLDPGVRRRLGESGLDTPERLVRQASTPDGRRAIAAASGVPEAEVAEAAARTRLVLHRGLGDDRASQLARLGIRRVEDLAGWTAEGLAAALRSQGPQPRDRFLERRARVWLSGP